MPQVLVINDDKDFRAYVATLLRDAGYAVLAPALNPLEKAALEAQTIDAIVSDLLASSIDVMQSVEIVRQRAPAVPLIGVSGGPSATRGRVMVAMKILSAKTTLTTPLDVAALLSLLRDALATPASSHASPTRSN